MPKTQKTTTLRQTNMFGKDDKTRIKLVNHTKPKDHYKVPGPAIISFSGGRTSGYLLHHIIEAYGGKLPDDLVVVYANTGRERPETLQFIQNCSAAWDCKVVWVEYDWDEPHRTKVVTPITASRNGEPFAAVIERKGFLPSVRMRFCTSFLKRDRIAAYARHFLGWKSWHSVIGFRADEPERVRRMRACDNSTGGERPYLPLDSAQITERMINDWWEAQEFNLGIPSLAGNCDLCFLKGRGKLLHIIKDQPELADWWIQQEENVKDRTNAAGEKCDSMKVFRLGQPYTGLKHRALTQEILDIDMEDEGYDCFCTD